MTDEFTTDSSTTKGEQPPLSPVLTWALLIAGGFMAGWGTLVTLALLVILVIQGPGSGGPAPFLAGAVVIGLAPIGFGAILLHLGRQRRREMRAENP